MSFFFSLGKGQLRSLMVVTSGSPPPKRPRYRDGKLLSEMLSSTFTLPCSAGLFAAEAGPRRVGNGERDASLLPLRALAGSQEARVDRGFDGVRGRECGVWGLGKSALAVVAAFVSFEAIEGISYQRW